MNNSFLYKIIHKLIIKRMLEKNKLKNRQKNVYLFLNSNPWFSAVTDFSLQLCLFLKKNNEEVLYGAEKGNTVMDKKCKDFKIPFFYISIHSVNFFNFTFSFFKIINLLSSNSKKIKYVITSEGREHTMLILSKILFPFLWHDKKLVRIRAQSQEVKAKLFSIIAYKYYTDKIIFVAECVLNRVQFKIPKEKYIVKYYCKESVFKENKLTEYLISEKFPKLQFKNLTFLVLGRFDPVKGHDIAVNSFLNSNLSEKMQLVFIGKSENLKAKDIYKKYAKICQVSLQDYNRYYLENNNKSIYIIDEYFIDLNSFMQNVHFGIISSLDSEVVCRVGVEFLQSGVPCIYSDAGALKEVFNDFPELNFQKANENSLVSIIENAAVIFKDTEKYQNLKLLAQKIGNEKYSLENFKNIF